MQKNESKSTRNLEQKRVLKPRPQSIQINDEQIQKIKKKSILYVQTQISKQQNVTQAKPS